MQTQEQKIAAITEFENQIDPRFARTDTNAVLIKDWLDKNAQGHFTLGNLMAAARALNATGQLQWLADPNATPTPQPTPPTQADVNLALAAKLAAEEDAAERDREERRAAEIQRRQGERAAQRQGKYGLGSSETVVRETGFKERRGKDSHAQSRDTSAPAATGHIESNFVAKRDQLPLDGTTSADLRKASPAQVRDFTKRLRLRDAKK
jgi:hypothetical protein